MTKSICIVAHFAYGAMTGGHFGHIGGVERQTRIMSGMLAERGYRVSVLTWDEGQEDETYVDGVRIIKMCRRGEGIPGIRFFHPRWTSLNRAMQAADAALYYQNCAEYVTGQVALWCGRHRRTFVYSVASDPDCDFRLPAMRTIRERVLYRYGLRRADRVIVQTMRQQRMLREGFGVDSVMIPMPCPDPGEGEVAPHRWNGHLPRRVVWVGRICPVKRLELLLDIAVSLPDVTFEIAGGPDADEEYCRTVFSRAARLGNVVVHGKVDPGRMGDIFGRAAVLCCTSIYEGFPNTFLEAWSRGLPVVSTVDPDGLIASRGIGVIASDRDGLAAGIRGFIESPPRWGEASTKARSYYLDNHALEPVVSRFEALFLDAIDGGRGVRS